MRQIAFALFAASAAYAQLDANEYYTRDEIEGVVLQSNETDAPTTPEPTTPMPTPIPTAAAARPAFCLTDANCRGNGDANAVCETLTYTCTCSNGFSNRLVGTETDYGTCVVDTTRLRTVLRFPDGQCDNGVVPADVNTWVASERDTLLAGRVEAIGSGCGSIFLAFQTDVEMAAVNGAAAASAVEQRVLTSLRAANLSSTLGDQVTATVETLASNAPGSFPVPGDTPAPTTQAPAQPCDATNAATTALDTTNNTNTCIVLTCNIGFTKVNGVCQANTMSMAECVVDGDCTALAAESVCNTTDSTCIEPEIRQLPPTVPVTDFSSFCTTDNDCRGVNLDPLATCVNSSCECSSTAFTFPAAAPSVRLCVAATATSVAVTISVEFSGLATVSATDRDTFRMIATQVFGSVESALLVTPRAGGGSIIYAVVQAQLAVLGELTLGRTSVQGVWNNRQSTTDRSATVLNINSATGGAVTRGVVCNIANAVATVQTQAGCRAVQCSTGFSVGTDGTTCVAATLRDTDDDLSAGEKAAIGVSVSLAVVVLIVIAVLFLGRKKSPQEQEQVTKENEPIEAA